MKKKNAGDFWRNRLMTERLHLMNTLEEQGKNIRLMQDFLEQNPEIHEMFDRFREQVADSTRENDEQD